MALRAVKRWMDEYIDYRIGLLAGLFLGSIVFVINHPHGLLLATTSALKQGAYTFLAGGLIARNNENLALRLREPWASLLLATFVSSCLAIGLTYFLHSLRGTAEPFFSTVPTMLFAPPSFFVLAWRAQVEERRKAVVATVRV